jgi:hypothetical protein
MSRGEERSSIFLLTAGATGLLTESVTRFVSLMRVTPSVVLCGLLALIFLLLHMGLTAD